jgi:hypothetical protein
VRATRWAGSRCGGAAVSDAGHAASLVRSRTRTGECGWLRPRHAAAHLELADARERPAVVARRGGVAQLALRAQADVGVRDHAAQQAAKLAAEGRHEVCVGLQRGAPAQHRHCVAAHAGGHSACGAVGVSARSN